MGTDFNAVMAAKTFLRIPHDLRPDQLTFRIGTPLAAQRASFEKDNGADSRSVIDREFLDIEYNAFVFHSRIPHIHRIIGMHTLVNAKTYE